MTYEYNLGHTAAVLVANKMSGHMATICSLKEDVSQWQASGVPITAVMSERALHVLTGNVDMSRASFRVFHSVRKHLRSDEFAGKPRTHPVLWPHGALPTHHAEAGDL